MPKGYIVITSGKLKVIFGATIEISCSACQHKITITEAEMTLDDQTIDLENIKELELPIQCTGCKKTLIMRIQVLDIEIQKSADPN